MDEPTYLASVIIPIFNSDKYLERCIESVINQTIGMEQIEIVLVDDGSTDMSGYICERYKRLFPNVFFQCQSNQGVSAARNIGMKNAKGKYVFFLDSDDTISNNTIEDVVKEFEENYDKTNIYTYHINKYNIKNEQVPYRHFRFNYLIESGVYDIDEYPYLCQTTMNICVKNSCVKKHEFDVSLKVHEDQKFINEIVIESGTIGFCKTGEYRYLEHSESVMSNNKNAIVLFEPTMKYYEELFSSADEIPRYIQAMFLNDLNWKIRSNVLWPYQYEKDQYDKAQKRVSDLLKKVDVDIIMHYPEMDNFNRLYWLDIRNYSEIQYIGMPDKIRLADKGKVIYSRDNMEIILNRVSVSKGKLRILCFAKSPVFTHTEKPDIILRYLNKKSSEIIEKKIECYDSAFGYYGTRAKTNTFWAVDFELILDETKYFELVVDVEGIRYRTTYFFMDNCPFSYENSIYTYVQENWCIRFSDNKFFLTKIDEYDRELLLSEANGCIRDMSLEHYIIRRNALQMNKSNRIALYYDCKGVKKDNAFLQFMHDISIDDGINKYFIWANDYEEAKEVFRDELLEYVIPFGSIQHKMLYLNADIIVTAYVEYNNVSPFSREERQFIKDLERYKTVYLQHGILHASVPWKYTPEKLRIDKLVVSTNYEEKVFTQKYHFRVHDLIKSGMPRFESMEIKQQRQRTNRILFAPSWRAYLVKANEQNGWDGDENRFVQSEYFCKIMEFLDSDRLKDFLEKENIRLDFKLHPIFSMYQNAFSFNNARIRILDGKVKQEQYDVFITDFSSFVYDFVFLKCPIIYFVPDMLEFRAGLNAYRELELPHEEGFGDLCLNSDEVVESLRKIAANGYVANEKYMTRMSQFFLPIRDCTDQIYAELKDMLEEV